MEQSSEKNRKKGKPADEAAEATTEEKGKTKKKKKEKPKKTVKREIFEWVMVFVVAAVMATFVRTFIFEPVRVDGSSMLETLNDGDLMIASKYDYIVGDPERFDIVICDYPNTDDGKYRVKRVVGLPGETIELRAGELYVDGQYVEQNFAMTENETYFGPYTVPEGHYFVMGDNRNNSKDSRSPLVGALSRDQIEGHVRVVIFPFENARWIED